MMDESPKPERKKENVASNLLRRVSTRTPRIFKWNRGREGSSDVGSSTAVQSDPRSSASHTHTSTSTSTKEKPLPSFPPPTEQMFEDTLCTIAGEGFPRRVARRSKRSSTQPDLIANSDGVLKADLQVNNELLNSIEWPGISIEYFIEASVYYGRDILRVRAPAMLQAPYSEI